MGELSAQSQHHNPALGQRSSGGQDPGAKSIEEGIVLLTSEVERGKLRESQKCLMS